MNKTKTTKLSRYPKTYRLTVLLACALLLMLHTVERASAHAAQRSRGIHRSHASKQKHRVNNRSSHAKNRAGARSSASLATQSIEPFTAIAREIAAGNGTTLQFKHTNLDDKASAAAQVALRGQTLLVRMRARNLPSPLRFEQRRYVLWADLPNYGQKMYIGDLPVAYRSMNRSSHRRNGSRFNRQSRDAQNGNLNERGQSDTAFRFTALPEGAVFGGLMLTAEPTRYSPVPSEPLHLLLVALPSKEDTNKLMETAGTQPTPKAK